MYVFDTDIITFHQRGHGQEYAAISDRMASVNEPIVLTMPSFEEQIKGWFALASRAKTPEEYSLASTRCYDAFRYFADKTVLSFDGTAPAIFRGIRSLKPRAGTMDLRIAAIALAHNATLVTRNVRDFAGIPSLRVEDWTKAIR
jgi:tRNA(fMet)-specific endonuclease VapC